MYESSLLIKALKKSLKHRGITYSDLAKKLAESEANIKRSFSKEAFSLQKFERICTVLGISLFDLVKTAEMNEEPEANSFTHEQEILLAKNVKLFSFFYLLLDGLGPRDIEKNYEFSKDETLKYAALLDKAKLIKLHPGDRIQLLASKNVRWIPQGPLKKAYEEDLKRDFLDSNFLGTNERIRLLNGSFAKHSVESFKKKVDRLISEFVEFAEMDKLGSTKNSERVCLLIAYRPWTFTKINQLRRRKA